MLPEINTQFETLRRACHLGVKSYQNLDSCLAALERLSAYLAAPDPDPIVCSGLFHMAVVRYSKPFVGLKTSAGTMQYPTRALKRTEGFSSKIHEHLIEVRNTLIAHDDFKQIEPRILSFSVGATGGNVHLPLEITISNKCLECASGGALDEIKNHVETTVEAVLVRLVNDISRFRDFVIEHPEDAKMSSKYLRDLGQIEVPVGGKYVDIPDLTGEPYLDADEPTFPVEYEYARVDVRVRFRDARVVEVDRGRFRVSYPDQQPPS